MEQYIPLIVSALGGVILGPLVARLTGGCGTGGMLGGIVGGGILAAIAGAVMKKS